MISLGGEAPRERPHVGPQRVRRAKRGRIDRHPRAHGFILFYRPLFQAKFKGWNVIGFEGGGSVIEYSTNQLEGAAGIMDTHSTSERDAHREADKYVPRAVHF